MGFFELIFSIVLVLIALSGFIALFYVVPFQIVSKVVHTPNRRRWR